MDVDRNWDRMWWGTLLMLLGALFLAERFGWLPSWAGNFNWWALIVIVLGMGSLVRHRHTKDIGTGVLFVLLGTWFLLVSNEQFGLTWHNSWPLALVATGASTLAKALAARWLPEHTPRAEAPHA